MKWNFVCISNCPTGIAHTNMAAEAMENYAKENNLNIKVETQGATGIQNKITKEDIKNAEYVIFAVGKPVEEKERFNGKKVLEVPVSEAIKDPAKLFMNAKQNSKTLKINSNSNNSNAGSNGGATPLQALMNGVSHMIPFVVTGGILIALSLGLGGKFVAGQGLQIAPGSIWESLLQLGVGGFTLMVPILAGYIAYSLAGRTAMAPAMIVAHVVGNSSGQLFNYSTMTFGVDGAKLGYLGGIASGFIIGLMVKYWNKRISIKIPKMLKPIEPIILIPLIITVLGWALFAFAIYLPIFFLSQGMQNGVIYLMDRNLFFLAAFLLGGMIGFDMGGPVNKVAFLIAGGMIAQGQPEVMGAVAAAIAVPPLGMALAVYSRKLFKTENKYNQNDISNASAATFMSMVGITEGAIPFAVKYPKQAILANVIGSGVGASIAAVFMITDNAQHGGPIVWLLGAVGRNGVTDYVYGLLFLLAILLGAIVTAFIMNSLLRRQK